MPFTIVQPGTAIGAGRSAPNTALEIESSGYLIHRHQRARSLD